MCRRLCSHVGAVEEVSDGEQRRQDSPEGLIGGQLLHAQLQVKQRLCDLLQGATHSQSEHPVTGTLFIVSVSQQNTLCCGTTTEQPFLVCVIAAAFTFTITLITALIQTNLLNTDQSAD